VSQIPLNRPCIAHSNRLPRTHSHCQSVPAVEKALACLPSFTEEAAGRLKFKVAVVLENTKAAAQEEYKH
jgi:hypothetical protein